jgi:hypothetical protein
MPAYPKYLWPAVIDPAKLSYTDFKDAFKYLPQKFHANLVDLIWDNTKLSEKEKMELLVDVIKGETKTSNSLNAKYFAGNKLALKMGIKWQPFDYGPIITEWENRQGTTTTKVE